MKARGASLQVPFTATRCVVNSEARIVPHVSSPLVSKNIVVFRFSSLFSI